MRREFKITEQLPVESRLLVAEQLNSEDPFYARMALDITAQGQSLLGVFAEEPGSKAFMYTIGLSLHEPALPELLLIGSNHPTVGGLLNHLANLMRSGQSLEPGREHDIGGRAPLRTVLATDKEAWDDYAVQVGRFTRKTDYRILQVIVPDKDGRWPGDPEMDPVFNCPVLGTRWWALH